MKRPTHIAAQFFFLMTMILVANSAYGSYPYPMYPTNPSPPRPSPAPSYPSPSSTFSPNNSQEQVDLTRRGRTPRGGGLTAARAYDSLTRFDKTDMGIRRQESQILSSIWASILDTDVNRNQLNDETESNFRNIILVDQDFYQAQEDRTQEEVEDLAKVKAEQLRKRKEEMEYRTRLSTRNYYQSEGRNVTGVIVVSEGYTGYTGLTVNSYHREYLAILKTIYIAKLMQSMAQYAAFLPGDGTVEAGTFLSMSVHDAVRRINEISEEIRKLKDKNPNDPKITELEEELEKLTTTSGMAPTSGAALEQFNQQREQIITGLRTQAETISRRHTAYEEAKEQHENADGDAEEEAALSRMNTAQGLYLQAANSNGLLLTQVEIGDFEGPLWRWLAENPDADATEAFTKAVQQYLDNVQAQVTQMSGTHDVTDMINFFGSPVMAPLRQEVGSMEKMNEYFPWTQLWDGQY